MSQKVCLLILDGFGINESTPAENAITQASPTPTFDRLFSVPDYTRLEASGRAVGIPDGFMGGSEVGHLTIGAGRVIPQSILEISDLLDSWAFAQIPEYREMMEYLRRGKDPHPLPDLQSSPHPLPLSQGERRARPPILHIASMLGYEWVHSYQKHLHTLLGLLPSDISISLHLFSDGRDSPIMSSEWYLSDLSEKIAKKSHIQIASLSGRYYAMDRDNNESRIEKAFSALIGSSPTDLSPIEVLQTSYTAKIFDEFIEPVSFSGADFLQSGDVLLHMHYRSDRGTQLMRRVEQGIMPWQDEGLIWKKWVEKTPALSGSLALLRSAQVAPFEKGGLGASFSKGGGMTKGSDGGFFYGITGIKTYTMTKYSDDLSAKYFIHRKNVEETLSEILSRSWKTQLHLAETEKFAHVTKFFNGVRSGELEGEKHLLIPSHKVKSYTEDPEMSAFEIVEVFDRECQHYDFSVVNLANGDMVGHTGDLDSAKQAVEALDRATARFIEICQRESIDLLITADHGNCETMGTPEAPVTSHTTNLVPLWYIRDGAVISTRPTGGLSAITPTILDIMGIEKGGEMEEGLLDGRA